MGWAGRLGQEATEVTVSRRQLRSSHTALVFALACVGLLVALIAWDDGRQVNAADGVAACSGPVQRSDTVSTVVHLPLVMQSSMSGGPEIEGCPGA